MVPGGGVRHRALRLGPPGRDGDPRLGADGPGRALHGRPQRHGVLGLEPAADLGTYHHRQPAVAAARAPQRHAPPWRRGPRRHETFEAALASFGSPAGDHRDPVSPTSAARDRGAGRAPPLPLRPPDQQRRTSARRRLAAARAHHRADLWCAASIRQFCPSLAARTFSSACLACAWSNSRRLSPPDLDAPGPFARALDEFRLPGR
jgi:hypothetical protein